MRAERWTGKNLRCSKLPSRFNLRRKVRTCGWCPRHHAFQGQVFARAGEAKQETPAFLEKLRGKAKLWLGASLTYGPEMRGRLARRVGLARRTGLPLLATNDVMMHVPDRRPLADVLTCIREKTTLDQAGRRLHANAERHVKTPAEVLRLFTEAPEAVLETGRFLAGLNFSLSQLKHDYPLELREGFATEQEALVAFAEAGAARRYSAGVPQKVRDALAHELALVAELDYAAYFLTVHDIVRFASRRASCVKGAARRLIPRMCYCLGITEVDPTQARPLSSNASFRLNARSRPTSTSISSTSGAKR